MTPQEALDRIAELCDDAESGRCPTLPARLFVKTVRKVLADVTPEPGGTLDRDQAHAVLSDYITMHQTDDRVRILKLNWPEDLPRILDRLAGCVRPATIDRDTLERLVLEARYSRGNQWTTEKFVDAIIRLIEPAAGVTLTPEEAEMAADALRAVADQTYAPETHRALAARLRAAR